MRTSLRTPDTGVLPKMGVRQVNQEILAWRFGFLAGFWKPRPRARTPGADVRVERSKQIGKVGGTGGAWLAKLGKAASAPPGWTGTLQRNPTLRNQFKNINTAASTAAASRFWLFGPSAADSQAQSAATGAR